MERLTFDGNFCDIAQCKEIPCPYNDACSARKVWERLKAYEDMVRDISTDRLRELAEADKNGHVVVLSCKAGDTVYEVTSRKTISEYRVKAIRVELFCTFIEWDIVAGFVDKSLFGVSVDEIGKTVFLTSEEAKKALEAMKK